MHTRSVLGFVWCLFICTTQAFWSPSQRLHRRIQSLTVKSEPIEERWGPFYFDQPIDHFDFESKTFKHRYWTNTDWYEPGGPVILYNAGEAPADERAIYVSNSSMATLARRLHGIVVVMEHRSYGESQPGLDYSVKNLRTLTTAQALEDMASMIKHLKFSSIDLDPNTKWIVYGGSYSGNLAAWMRLKYPELVFAAVPSSAPVQMSYNFYEYFNAVQRYAPPNCTHAIRSVVRHVDLALLSPFPGPRRRIKALFGLEDLEHDDDFAEVLTFPLGLWQAMQPDINPFGEFCELFELTEPKDHLAVYGAYIKAIIDLACDGLSVNECLDTHDPRSIMYTDLKSEARPWMWQVCTEYAYWQTAAPLWESSIVSRHLSTSWYQHQCPLMFGEHQVPPTPIWRQINEEYEGWNIRLSRTFWIDGEWDPWRTLSVQSDDAPNRSTWQDDAYFSVLPQAVHHWDFHVSETVDQSIKDTQDALYDVLNQWLEEDKEKESFRMIRQD
ncbi:hypothetical protein PHYBLDRAFT_179228 [Phycomyces blakesleeanus NRRL 1555(-)]|uniref:Uncharacterized protein n=1 Tax=Phycomyces blakesleeanus (strain ATCC 8743b / DSM 1359 / FGSC 10004 / NBRC 33097 / NRRL 1555) TaxID=763407 RepID=A0A167QIG0_PHYB8|nr:hypothetical protein PHYBLDRAFT_179228 [Phycomyces blakesleeanus NRRL 1555(-)]OAD79741.1 hypothetical protein PHYBLDRAFT_179228 [Phycomyces blakesleeanus NRRL 1555(-)]|eukprot:XP_018297781.1 hypothetical protein PHYBLDRAFT_179228 [Phycomyces blakesleeanus NRRL 1555(-)]